MKMFVKKRDKALQPWKRRKVVRAMFSAFDDVQPDDIPNVRELAIEVEKEVQRIAKQTSKVSSTLKVDIEVVQETVTKVLSRDYPEVGAAYDRYRTRRTELRQQRLTPDPNAIADYIHAAKYARYLPDEKRREMYDETVQRSFLMHHKKFIHTCVDEKLAGELTDAFNAVSEKKLLPSMRSMQFGGNAIERNNVRVYNCAFTLIDRGRVFAEIYHSLLSGCGVGYSVQFQHVERLPQVKKVDRRRVHHYEVRDSIEGWADALNELVRAYYVTGEYVEFGYESIRPEGSELSTGGKAPGHLPLKLCLELVRRKFEAASGRRMRPIEHHDVICVIAESVLSGGIRRSSLISMFSAHDSEMMYCKAHENFRPAFGGDPGVNSQRQMANNSAVLLRANASWETFKRIVDTARQWGDPSFYFTDDLDFGCNPCGEIGLHPKIKGKWNGVDKTLEFDWEEELGEGWGDTYDEAIAKYGHTTGFQFCNLCEINVATCRTPEDFIDASRKAAFIGTLQAAYTNFYYLGPVTVKCVEDEALLGVGITGIMDNPEIGLNPNVLREGALAAVEENRRVAEIIGVKPAARVTTVKPSGTASLELGCVGSGIHYHHARRYFRRITANPNEPIAIAFREQNPHMVETKPNGDLSIVFPVKAPDGAKVVKEESGIEFMDHVFTVYENWVKPGSLTTRNRKKLTHNVSCTITVSDEWEEAIKKAWMNRDKITAMSFMSVINDKAFPYAPREEVVTDADEAKWNYLIENYTPLDYSKLTELSDDTAFTQDPACSGGTCDV